MQSAVILFLKYPEPGRVKTRLAATVGIEAAAEAYRILVAHVCRQLPMDADIHVFFDPPAEEERIRRWLEPLLGPGFFTKAQVAGNLGERLSAAFADVFAQGAEQALVVGTDCVELTPEIFATARATLDKVDVVIGPTHDGGYYLMGLKRPAPALFREIEWSTERTLAQTLRQAEVARLAVRLIARCHDVDDEADWRRAQSWLADGH